MIPILGILASFLSCHHEVVTFFSDQFHGWDCIGWFSRCVKTEWMAVDMAQIFYGSAGSEGIQVWVQAVRDVVSDALENQFLFHSVRMEVSATSRPS